MSVVRRSEEGVALIAALIVMLLVVGVIGIFSMLAVGESQQGRSDRQRAESLQWVEAASAQVLTQLRSHDIGPHSKLDFGTSQLWRVPGPGGRRTISVTLADGTTRSGYFEILAPVRGAPADTVQYVRDPSNRQQRGDVVLVLRGSAEVGQAPRAARVVFRRSSLAKYAVVSDAPIDVGNLGRLTLGGSIHSNNVENEAVGIRISGASRSGAKRISTTQGRITGGCPASSCLPDSQKAVSFTNIDHAFAEAARVAARKNPRTNGACAGPVTTACVVNMPVTWHPPGTAPLYRADLRPAGLPDGCVSVTRIANPLRVDAGFAAIVDDRRAPVGPLPGYTGRAAYCPSPADSPMALLFNTDVQVEGLRSATAPAVTIMAKNMTNPTTIVNGGQTTRQQPASIYVVGRGGGLGASSSPIPTVPENPVGLIAEGSVYLPDWAIGAGNNRNLTIQHVAMAAKEGELSLGPMSIAMAGSLQGLSGNGSDAREGGGLNPCATEADTFDGGARLTIVGAVASRREPVLGYGTSNPCSFGFNRREYAYSGNLEWNPPPLYPTTSPWHVAEWDELAVGP